MAEFKDRLKELRKEKGLTQKELANLLGKTESVIRKYENGSVFPRIANVINCYDKGSKQPNNFDTLIGLAQFFDVSTDYLLGLSDIRKIELEEIEIKSLSDYSTEELFEELKRRCK